MKSKYEAEQKEMARLQGFVDRFGAQARMTIAFGGPVISAVGGAQIKGRVVGSVT